jgi:hypothetical protein
VAATIIDIEADSTAGTATTIDDDEDAGTKTTIDDTARTNIDADRDST